MEESNMVSDHSKCVTFDALVAMPTGTEDHDGGPEAQRRAWERLLTASSRGALAGLTLKGGLHLLSAAVRVLSRGAQQQQRPAGKNAGRGRDPLTDALRDTVSYTLFLGSLAGVYVIVDEGLAAALGRERTRRWRAFAAGAAAGPALLLTGAGSRHYSLATYVLLRGLTLLVRQGNKASTAEAHPLLHRLLALTRTAHGDVALMCLSAAQIVYSFIMEPASLPASYVRFISRAAGKSTAVVAAVRELAVRNAGGQPPLPLPCLLEGGHSAALGAAHACSPNPGIPCSYLHHGASCSGHVAQLLPATYVRALAVYLPVYVAPAALLHR